MTGKSYGAYTSDRVDEVSCNKLAHGGTGATLGFYSATPATQQAVTYNATITVTWVTISSGFGFLSSDQAVSVIGAIKDMQHVLTTLGLWS